MYVERAFVLDMPLQRAWTFLNEPQEVGRCLPGCHTVELVEPGTYKASVGFRAGPVKASFDVQIVTAEERPPEFAAYTMRGADRDGGSKVSAECTLALAALDARRTQVTYTSKAHIVGRLGKFAGGIMQKFADGINDQFVAALVRRSGELDASAANAAEVSVETGESLLVRFFRRIVLGLKAVFGQQAG